MYRVADASLIGRPENPPSLPVENLFEVEGQTLSIPDEPVRVVSGGTEAQTRHRLEVIPPVSLHLLSEVRLFAPGSTRPVEVEVTASRPAADRCVVVGGALAAPLRWLQRREVAAANTSSIADPSPLLARYLSAVERLWQEVDRWRS